MSRNAMKGIVENIFYLIFFKINLYYLLEKKDEKRSFIAHFYLNATKNPQVVVFQPFTKE